MRLAKLAYDLVRATLRLRDLQRAEDEARRNVRDFQAGLSYWRTEHFRSQERAHDTAALVTRLKAELRFPRPRAVAPYRRA